MDAPENGDTETPKSGGSEGVQIWSISFHKMIKLEGGWAAGGPGTHLGGFRARPTRTQPTGRASPADGQTGRATRSRAIGPRAMARQASGRRSRIPVFERSTRVRIVWSADAASHDEVRLQEVHGKKAV